LDEKPWRLVDSQMFTLAELVVHADAHAVTRDAWLCDLEQSFAYPVAIANSHLLVGEAVDREILPNWP
jgi:hypothetical protein